MNGSLIQELPNLTQILLEIIPGETNLTAFLLEIWIIDPRETPPYFIPPGDMDFLSKRNLNLFYCS